MELEIIQRKVAQANVAAMEYQANLFFNVYQDIEQFVQENRPEKLTIEKLRDQIKNHVDVNNLPPSFQLLFLGKQQQLIRLTQDFSNLFIHRMGLGDKLKTSREDIAEKIPGLTINQQGNLDFEVTLGHFSTEKDLIATLTQYLNFFYQKGSELLSSEKVKLALKESYHDLQQKYFQLAVIIFPILPAEVLSKQEKYKLLLGSYRQFTEKIMQQITEKKLTRDLTPSYQKLNDNLQSIKIGDDGETNLRKHHSEFFEKLIEKVKIEFGHSRTQRIFEQSYQLIKEKYGAYPVFNEILKSVPRGILEVERFNMLSKEELEKVSKALKRTEQIKATFTNIAAHELQTPLVPIIGFSQMLSNKKLPFHKVQKYAKIIYDSAFRENMLVKDLLDISRLEAGEMKFELVDVNLIPLLRQAPDTLLIPAKQKQIQFKFILPKSLPNVLADPGRLIQVITNIIGNALKFTEKGIITIAAKVIDNNIRVCISDTGMGIEKKDIANVFDKFFQTQDYTTRKTDGTGLGLAICKEIIQVHHGKIWVESKGVGKGSKFFFTLPLIGAVQRQNGR
jgi:signal transduction histidine kinase